MTGHERQGTGYDPDARGHELQGRRTKPSDIQTIADAIIESVKAGGKLMVCGNGGSNAQAQHLVAELLVRYKIDRPPIPAMCLDMDPATLTASCNDFSFDQHYERMVLAFGQPGDCLLAISTSGLSRNVLSALWCAKVLKQEILTIGMFGPLHGEVWCDMVVRSDASDTASIQEDHIRMCHLLAELVEDGLYGN